MYVCLNRGTAGANLPLEAFVKLAADALHIAGIGPDSANAQGNSNVTHGCVNLSLTDAEAYYNSAIWGDPVEVSGTNVNLSSMDGDIYIWGMSWDEWKAMSITT